LSCSWKYIHCISIGFLFADTSCKMVRQNGKIGLDRDWNTSGITPFERYCKLRSSDSEAAFRITVYVYYKKRLSSPKEHYTSLNYMVDYTSWSIIISYMVAIGPTNHRIIYGYDESWLVGPIAIMFDAMIVCANSYHIWYNDWLGQ
jgi:hypothetical protein